MLYGRYVERDDTSSIASNSLSLYICKWRLQMNQETLNTVVAWAMIIAVAAGIFLLVERGSSTAQYESNRCVAVGLTPQCTSK